MKQCYMCEASGITREHVPPLAFFPKGYRNNLFTVPSCEEHNHKNSTDVEYVRNVIVSHIDTNALARTFFRSKVLRSYARSPKLKYQTFAETTPIIIQGAKTGIVELDMPRFKSVIQAIGNALYFKDFGQRFMGQWLVFSVSLVAANQFVQSMSDGWEELRFALQALPYTAQQTANPEVFKYSSHSQENGTFYCYRLEFYEGFVVHLIRELVE